MHLGTLLASLQDDAGAGMALEALGDIVLFAQVQSAGERFGETPGAYTAGAVGRFAAGASDEQWLGLVAAAARNADPARAALAHVLAWAMRQDDAGQCSSDHSGRSCHCGDGDALRPEASVAAQVRAGAD